MGSVVRDARKPVPETRSETYSGFEELADQPQGSQLEKSYTRQLPRYWLLVPVGEPRGLAEPLVGQAGPPALLRRNLLAAALFSAIVSLTAAIFLFAELHP